MLRSFAPKHLNYMSRETPDRGDKTPIELIAPSDSSDSSVPSARVHSSVVEDYEPATEAAGVGISDPKVWGPCVWKTLHILAAGYPAVPSKSAVLQVTMILRALPILLPCPVCKNHALNYMNSINIVEVTSSRENLARFFIDMHNYVNKRYGKQELSYEYVVSTLYPFFTIDV